MAIIRFSWLSGLVAVFSPTGFVQVVNLPNIISVGLMGGLGWALLIGISALRSKYSGGYVYDFCCNNRYVALTKTGISNMNVKEKIRKISRMTTAPYQRPG
jgi:hypothetical protein